MPAPTLRTRMALLYGTVICASAVALVIAVFGITKAVAPGLISRRRYGGSALSPPGAIPGGHSPGTFSIAFGPSVVVAALAAVTIVAVVSMALGWLIAGRFVRPLRSIIATTRDISASNLHRRLGLRGRGDELTELGETIDDLPARARADRVLDLAEITRKAVRDRQHEAESHGVSLSAALGPAPATADPSLAESLIANLIDNAIRHNIPGGQVTISTAMTSAGAAITVGNTGTLIPPDAVEHLFQPFRQLGTQRIRHNGGHGLGLAIIRAIADAHGAALSASPRPQGGLDIAVTFP